MADAPSASGGKLPDELWLYEWNKLQASSPKYPQAPMSAWAIHTPLRHSSWAAALKDYGQQPMVEFFLSGI